TRSPVVPSPATRPEWPHSREEPMPTPTTVLEFATNTFDATTEARETAQTDSTAAQQALGDARTALEVATANLKETEGELAVKRVEVAAADTPAEAAALAAELAALVALQRERQAELLSARQGLASAISGSEQA